MPSWPSFLRRFPARLQAWRTWLAAPGPDPRLDRDPEPCSRRRVGARSSSGDSPSCCPLSLAATAALPPPLRVRAPAPAPAPAPGLHLAWVCAAPCGRPGASPRPAPARAPAPRACPDALPSKTQPRGAKADVYLYLRACPSQGLGGPSPGPNISP